VSAIPFAALFKVLHCLGFDLVKQCRCVHLFLLVSVCRLLQPQENINIS
jgi:hypothetical protein